MTGFIAVSCVADGLSIERIGRLFLQTIENQRETKNIV
jgi:hypothetical protein